MRDDVPRVHRVVEQQHREQRLEREREPKTPEYAQAPALRDERQAPRERRFDERERQRGSRRQHEITAIAPAFVFGRAAERAAHFEDEQCRELTCG